MKIVVVGGTGLIGSKVVNLLARTEHEVVAASRATGVNSYTTEGLEKALDGAETVIDLSNSSYTDQEGALDFFYTSTLNLLTFGQAAGVRHHVALSVVGTDRLAQTERGYFFAKDAQETLIRRSSLPYSIVHATQFFEFVRSIGNAATRGNVVRLSHARVQPMAGDDVAAAVVRTALGEPTNSTVEFAGPEVFGLTELVQLELRSRNDTRQVVADPLARYFGNALAENELLPAPDAYTFPTRFEDWLQQVKSAKSLSQTPLAT
ncbi:SDR family oxidoreductase [Leifsonia kafniensis]|uniref:SDR family oxidoreductase n=1 Tax=Leifsonia kafniensis TaxID=475957 RepID=A0ABP7K345_9MICO